jgi:hypothetical protein
MYEEGRRGLVTEGCPDYGFVTRMAFNQIIVSRDKR